MKKIFMLVAVACIFCALAASAQSPALLRGPSVGSSQIVFGYGNEIWSVARDGGVAHVLTTGPGTKAGPFLSPDGKWIAYTGRIDGNTDVYVIPAQGGVPRRLTFHPGPDQALGWTPDSQQVLFSSIRNSYSRFVQMFTVGLQGGLPSEVPLPEAIMGSYSPDGKQIAYVPFWNRPGVAWKRYRGGRAARIWIARLSDSNIERIPRDNSNDLCPMWLGNKIYFLSDRNGPMTLFAYDTGSKKVETVVPSPGTDIKWASAAAGVIVYEQVGTLHRLDLATGKTSEIKVEVAGDLPARMPHFIKAAREISDFDISPSGARAVFEAHGEIMTVPAQKGDIRNLTGTTGVAERSPAWSPDGRWIAYFSDESGEYALHLRSQDGTEVKKIGLGDPPSFFYSPVWSPDSRKIAYTDKRLNLWYIDLAKGAPVKVATDYYEAPFHTIDPAWSPDSRWLVYTLQLASHMRAAFVYSLDSGKAQQVTDGLSDARFAVFDRGGKYIFFTASTNAGPTNGWLDMTSDGRAVTRSVYAIVLRTDLPSPVAPESDEEKIAAEKPPAENPAAAADKKDDKQGGKGAKEAAPAKPAADDKAAAKKDVPNVLIEFDNISQRIVALPIPARNYDDLQTGAAGVIYLQEAPVPQPGVTGRALYRFELETRKTTRILDGLGGFRVSADGKKMLYVQGPPGRGRWFIASTPPPTPPGAPDSPEPPHVQGHPLNTGNMEVYVDPQSEWKQMYHEAWRIQRDFFYDSNHHGLNLQQAEKHYGQFVDGLSSRDDLDYLFLDMLGELTVGHMYITPPTEPDSTQPHTGLLGADYRVEHGRYRFARVYQGENWNPELRAPLTEPGVNVQEGDYLLEVNGRELKGTDNIYEFFQGTAGRSVTLRVAANPEGKDARTVQAVPIDNEGNLRNRAWIDQNRRKVDELSGGKLAYVYLPDTGFGGYTSFNRYYFAQVGRQGAVLDERFNGGGQAADYIIDYLRKPLMNYFMTREGHDFTTPVGSIFGPKAMIINMYAGSGGDALPWYFRDQKIGPMIGTRTWGGLVGIYDYPPFIDGGGVTSPRVAFYNTKGEWDVENHGVPPDIEVEFLPQAWRQGHDPQLEKAVEVLMEQLKTNPPPEGKRPAFPNYHQQK
ncbi:MAG: PDZ domain-containing protein [Acidobacteriia bacterium]|nr:PDZ domain-containing protein [Terriglobia bacterium]